MLRPMRGTPLLQVLLAVHLVVRCLNSVLAYFNDSLGSLLAGIDNMYTPDIIPTFLNTHAFTVCASLVVAMP